MKKELTQEEFKVLCLGGLMYDEWMDKECIGLCDALNSLPGVKTFESCCGHLKNKYMIFFTCDNPYSLGVIARAFDRRYCGTEVDWTIELETSDSDINGYRYNYFLHSNKPYRSYELMNEELEHLIGNINYWRLPKFKDHFLCKEP